jgi:hypothetical protein
MRELLQGQNYACLMPSAWVLFAQIAISSLYWQITLLAFFSGSFQMQFLIGTATLWVFIPALRANHTSYHPTQVPLY